MPNLYGSSMVPEMIELLELFNTLQIQKQMWSEYGPEEYEIEVDLIFDGIELFYPEEYYRYTGICAVCGGENKHYPIEHGYTYGGVPLTQPCPVEGAISYWDRIDADYETKKDVILSQHFPS